MLNWNIGFILYITNCFIGSFTVIIQFAYEVNSDPYFHISISDNISIAIMLAGLSLLIFLPLFLILNYIGKRTKNEIKRKISSNVALLLYSVALIILNSYLTMSLLESSKIMLCYLVPGLFFLNFYLVLRRKKENF